MSDVIKSCSLECHKDNVVMDYLSLENIFSFLTDIFSEILKFITQNRASLGKDKIELFDQNVINRYLYVIDY